MRASPRVLSVVAAVSVSFVPVGLVPPAGAATDHPVSIGADRAFSPIDLTVAVDDSVTWTNTSTEDHNMRGGPFSSPRVPPNGNFSYTFTKAARIKYVCDFHPTMKGTITVG